MAMIGFAVLPTGYFGGAVAAHVRAGRPLFTPILSGVYRGIVVRDGLWLRDPRIPAPIPLSA